MNDTYGSVIRADKAVHRSIYSVDVQATIIYIIFFFFPACAFMNLDKTLKHYQPLDLKQIEVLEKEDRRIFYMQTAEFTPPLTD